MWGASDHTFTEIAQWLCNLEKMPWKELMANEKQFHRHPVSSVCKDARERLEKLKLEDCELVYSLHRTSMERLWCLERILNGSVAIVPILWWDPEHEVYPTEPHNT
jgi:hypothetical protein